MKRLECELCGCTDFVKEDGMFTCQACGCKYTLEEARKMMIEGTVEVKGTVTVDRSKEYENILLNADRAFEDGSAEEAGMLYTQVLNLEPNNAHAILSKGLCNAWRSSVKEDRLQEACNSVRRGLKIKHEQAGDTKEYFDFCIAAVKQYKHLLTAISNMYANYYKKLMSAGVWTFDSSHTTAIGILSVAVATSEAIDLICDPVTSFAEAEEGFFSILIDFSSVIEKNNGLFGIRTDLKPAMEVLNKTQSKIWELEGRERARREAEYAATHAEEMAEKAARRNAVFAAIDAVYSKEQREFAMLNEQIGSLRMQAAGLRSERDKKTADVRETQAAQLCMQADELERRKAALFVPAIICEKLKAQGVDATPVEVETYMLANTPVGGQVSFGAHYKCAQPAPINWIVMARQGAFTMLVCRYCYKLPQPAIGAAWRESAVRRYMNGDFLSDNFTDEERGMIFPSMVSNADTPVSSGNGPDTQDKLFSLSETEAKGLMASIPGAGVANLATVTEENVTVRGGAWWWLRSCGKGGTVLDVSPGGAINYKGHSSNDARIAARPAMWIKTGL